MSRDLTTRWPVHTSHLSNSSHLRNSRLNSRGNEIPECDVVNMDRNHCIILLIQQPSKESGPFLHQFPSRYPRQQGHKSGERQLPIDGLVTLYIHTVNTLRPRQNGRHFADDIFKCIFLNENVWIPTKMSMNFVPKCPIDNIPALVQIMAWRRPGDKRLSEPIMVSLLTHLCVTRSQWVKRDVISQQR